MVYELFQYLDHGFERASPRILTSRISDLTGIGEDCGVLVPGTFRGRVDEVLNAAVVDSEPPGNGAKSAGSPIRWNEG